MRGAPPARPRALFRASGLFDGVTGSTDRDRALLVDGGSVVAVGPYRDLRGSAGEEHDFGSSVILPGFVDAHTHITIRPGEGDQHGQFRMPPVWQAIRGVRNVADMLSSGVTTARVMSEAHGIDFEFRDAVARGEVAGPRLLVSGFGLSPPGGHGSGEWGVAGPAALRAAVQERAALRADHIKVFMTGGVSSAGSQLTESNYDLAECTAIVTAARQAGITAAAHALGGPGVDIALEAGIHSIEHGTMLTPPQLAAIERTGTWLVLTTSILFAPEAIESGDGQVPQIMDKLLSARSYMLSVVAGMRSVRRLALGTDSMHGLFGREIKWLVAHGWTPSQALLAGTRNGGELISDPRVGVLRPGSFADFVVVPADPLVDVDAVGMVSVVYRGGHRVASGGRVTPAPEAEAVAVETPG
jgi:imidazolonepropionase-like amidohydrolase